MTENVLQFDPAGAKRRQAFAALYKDYPRVVFGVMRNIGLRSLDSAGGMDAKLASELLMRPDFPRLGAQCLAAQFAARCMATRAGMEKAFSGPNGPLQIFCNGVVTRVFEQHADLLKGFELVTVPNAEHAKTEYENEIAGTIFQSLLFEAEHRPNEFDETKFWLDAFRGLADADSSGSLTRGFSVVFLDHADEYRALLQAELRTTHAAHDTVM